MGLGTLTRDEFVTEICDTVGKSVSASAVSGATLQTRVRTYLNWAQARIARFYSFHELNTLYESAATVDGTKRYPMITGTSNLGLTRPKDISSIRLIDSENSRTLVRWSQRKFDKHFPYPTNYTEQRPKLYIRWGSYVEMFPIPDDAYTLHIRYPQWPTVLSTGTQTTDFEEKDQLLITGGILETYLALEEYDDAEVWYARFLGQLKDAVVAEGDVDWEPQAEEFNAITGYSSGSPWTDPYGTPEDPLGGYPE